MAYGPDEKTGLLSYRAIIGKVGLDGFYAEVVFDPAPPRGGTEPDEATTDAAFQEFVEFIDNSDVFEFKDISSSTYPPQKWTTIKNEVTPDS